MILSSLLWILLASILSFLTSAIFAGQMQLKRNHFLLAYIPISGGIITGYYLISGTNIISQMTHHWAWGLLGALVAGYFAVRHVFGQPSSPRRNGASLLLDLLRPGLIYGTADAMLLSVIPVIVVYQGFSQQVWVTSLAGEIGLGCLAFLASMMVTFCYHIGYPEYHGKQVFMTLVGNGIMTLALLMTGNPLAAILAHSAMHITAMWHGRETTYQLPPHYGKNAIQASA